MTQPTLIFTEGITKTYGSGDHAVRALRGVTVSINAGSFVALMGTSGSGKSTFLNIVGCLDRPSSGRYLLNGADVSQLDRDERAEIRSRMLGFVFQNFNLLKKTSALENVELPLLYSAVPVSATERRQRAMAALESVGLSDRWRHTPSELSGGQQQRVAIARALVNRPEVILADEPTGALDSRTSIEIMAILQRLNRDGITLVMVTHEPDIADHAGRLLRFSDGKLIEDSEVRNPRDAARELETLPAAEVKNA